MTKCRYESNARSSARKTKTKYYNRAFTSWSPWNGPRAMQKEARREGIPKCLTLLMTAQEARVGCIWKGRELLENS